MKTILALVLSVLVNQSLMAHEAIIQGVINHSPYLEKSQVKSFGDLRLIRENKLTQSFPYSKIKSDDLYGIGMPAGLDKELMITSGNLYESFFDQNKYSASVVKEDRDIAFLAYVNVKKWKTVVLPEDITTFAQLETTIPELAKNTGINLRCTLPIYFTF